MTIAPIYTLFKRTIANHKEETAIMEGAKTITFGELCGLADKIAHRFPEAVNSIGIVSHRATMFVSLLTVLKCGARHIPAESGFPAARNHNMTDEAKETFTPC